MLQLSTVITSTYEPLVSFTTYNHAYTEKLKDHLSFVSSYFFLVEFDRH